MALPIVALARTAFSLYSVHEATGVLGWDQVAGALARLVPKMALKAHHRDSGALADMIDTARANVPQDTGLLLNGITGEDMGDYLEFRASAVRTSASGKEQEDYAHFVEFGTQAGVRGQSTSYQANAGIFSLPADATSAFPSGQTSGRTRRQYRTHPGTEAQPFFYPAAADALARRHAEMSDYALGAAGEDGWETGQ